MADGQSEDARHSEGTRTCLKRKQIEKEGKLGQKEAIKQNRREKRKKEKSLIVIWRIWGFSGRYATP